MRYNNLIKGENVCLIIVELQNQKQNTSKKALQVFQKTVATIASILGLITASITIMNALDNNKKY